MEYATGEISSTSFMNKLEFMLRDFQTIIKKNLMMFQKDNKKLRISLRSHILAQGMLLHYLVSALLKKDRDKLI